MYVLASQGISVADANKGHAGKGEGGGGGMEWTLWVDSSSSHHHRDPHWKVDEGGPHCGLLEGIHIFSCILIGG